MKSFSNYLFICLSLILSACSTTDETSTEKSISCHATYTINNTSKDSLFFNEKDIEYFDTTSNELKLTNSFSIQEIQHFNNFTFYMGNDSLFMAKLALDLMSSMINDLVLHQSSYDNKLYLEDGYPTYIDNISVAILRAENKAKREANWKLFIARLQLLNKIK